MQLRAQKTREAILTAGMRLFSSCGFSGTAVDAVAADAGVTTQRIYAYFGSKQGLFEAVLTEALGNRDGILCSEKSLQEAGAHPERLTEILLEAFWKQHDAHPEFWRLLAWANLENDDDDILGSVCQFDVVFANLTNGLMNDVDLDFFC